MKSLFVDKLISKIHVYFILLIVIANARLTSSAALSSRNSISLYNENDKVIILTNDNFTSIVYQSKTAWLIEFYASWCGHCQSYANTYREVAIDTWGWKTVVRIGAINCYAEENNALCEQHNISAYPTLRLIEPETMMNKSKVISISAYDAKGVERELIKELDQLKRTGNGWPNFMPLYRISFEDIFGRTPSSVKLTLVILERQDDFTGRQIMLDFSKYYQQLAIFRTFTDKRFWFKFHINVTNIPAVFAVFPNKTVEELNTTVSVNENIGSRNLFNYAIRSYLHRTKLIDNFNDRDLEEIIHSKNVLKTAETIKNAMDDNTETNNHVKKISNPSKISMIDLETSLSYMLRQEVPRIKIIQGDTYDTLVHWLTILTKYFPGREPIMNYLKRLLKKINEQSNGLTGKEFQELADTNMPDSYLPNAQFRYEYCAGSSPQYRGYPCALWTLFHTLTVSQVKSSGSEKINVIEIPSAVKNFIKNFFSCRYCSENFMKETNDIHKLDSNNKHAAILYFWKIHNSVNRRLHSENKEDPEHPKVPFPPSSLCTKCQAPQNTNDDHFDVQNTLDFLLRYYSKDNIDSSSIGNSSVSNANKDDITLPLEHQKFMEKYSMIEISNKSTETAGWFRSMTSTIARFPFLFLVLIVIIIIFVRGRFFKGKRKRYTL